MPRHASTVADSKLPTFILLYLSASLSTCPCTWGNARRHCAMSNQRTASDGLKHATSNNQSNWKPRGEVLAGLSAGMSRREVYSVKGEPYALQNEPNRDWDTWHFTTSKRPDMAVRYANDLVTEIRVINLRIDLDGTGCGCFQGQVCAVRSCRGKSSGDRIPFSSVAQMHEILGNEDILAASRANSDEMYTYAQWGVSYEFENDTLVGAAIGPGNWRNYRNGDYFVKGQQVCPGDACPWDDEGEIKPEFQGSNYRDFLEQFSNVVEEVDP